MNYRELNGISIREGFEKFNKENPHIFKAFENEALRALSMGRTKISAKLLINWIRWHEFVTSNDESFKINDAYQSYYARHFVAKYPQYHNVFDFRKLRNEEGGPYMFIEENGQLAFL